jgi:putative membrane protein
MHFLVRWLINAAALWVAVRLVSGVTFSGHWSLLLAVALVFGALNAVVRPVLKLLSLPLLIVTLGLFTFVINAVMLLLTSAVSGALGLGFRVSGFGAAFWGALAVSLVSLALSMIARD